MRSFLLKYITQIEEEIRTLTGYKFDECNDNGAIPWYDTNAYSPNESLQRKMTVISKAYNELSKSQLDYVKFYTRSQGHNDRSGRILEQFFAALGQGYTRDLNQRLFDLIVYFKYYLPKSEYKRFIFELKIMLSDLQDKIHPHAFEYVRGQIGIKDLDDLQRLLALPRDDI